MGKSVGGENAKILTEIVLEVVVLWIIFFQLFHSEVVLPYNEKCI